MELFGLPANRKILDPTKSLVPPILEPTENWRAFAANQRLVAHLAAAVDHNIAEFFVMRHFRRRNGRGHTTCPGSSYSGTSGLLGNLRSWQSKQTSAVLLAKSHCRHAPFELRADRGRTASRWHGADL